MTGPDEKSQQRSGRNRFGRSRRGRTLFFAGGGVLGGTGIGPNAKIGACPIDSPQRPKGMAATISSSPGIPATAAYHDDLDRPNHSYHREPIPGLMG